MSFWVFCLSWWTRDPKKDFFVCLGLSKIAETHEHINKCGKNDRLIF